MALTKAEYKRRLDAAMALTGMKRSDLPDLLEQHGLKRYAAARAGHETDTTAAPNKALANALGEILGVGRPWFEEPDWRKVVVGAEPDATLRIDQEGRRALKDLKKGGVDQREAGAKRRSAGGRAKPN
jgi:hypothetical protein